MNRHERRRAAKQRETAKAIYTHWGHLHPAFKHYKQPTDCYVCNEIQALDVVAIDDGSSTITDPYEIFPPFEEDNVGRNYSARTRGGDVWVDFGVRP
jgi:hypothetical protein